VYAVEKEDCVEAVEGREVMVGVTGFSRAVSRMRIETARRWLRWKGGWSRFSDMMVKKVGLGTGRTRM
jgi:hypothetical protein